MGRLPDGIGLWGVLIYGTPLLASKVFPQSRYKNAHIDWLCDMVVHSGFQCHLSVLGEGICRHCDDGDIRLLGMYFSSLAAASDTDSLSIYRAIITSHSFGVNLGR